MTPDRSNFESRLSRMKARAFDEAGRRGLVSAMNDTKWRELIGAIRTRLRPLPPFQIKDLMVERPYPTDFDGALASHADWTEEILWPYFSTALSGTLLRPITENAGKSGGATH